MDIPAGSHDGDVVRIAGMGNAGTNGKASGDFVCRVEVPSEHVNVMHARGFHCYGFATPIMLLGLLLWVDHVEVDLVVDPASVSAPS